MATYGIDVVFTGLMLICFDGQTMCPKGYYAERYPDQYKNTAWVVRADPNTMPCGREGRETTRLELTYNPKEVTVIYQDSQIKCEREPKGDRWFCVLAYDPGPPVERDICVIPSSGALAQNRLLDESFLGLPHIDEVDRRFKALRMDRLRAPYVPTRIYFPGGEVNTGPKWPSAIPNQTTLWYRSNGESGGDLPLPRDLSDRLNVTYQAATAITLVVANCQNGKKLIELKQGTTSTSIFFRNTAIGDLMPNQVGQFDDLGYLLWYYLLGSWNTPFPGTCPDYASGDSVLLRCIRDSADGCAYRPSLQSDTRFWPPTVKP